jgi:hypothetical protein
MSNLMSDGGVNFSVSNVDILADDTKQVCQVETKCRVL